MDFFPYNLKQPVGFFPLQPVVSPRDRKPEQPEPPIFHGENPMVSCRISCRFTVFLPLNQSSDILINCSKSLPGSSWRRYYTQMPRGVKHNSPIFMTITIWLFKYSHGKSPCLIGKPSINGPFSMAMLNNQRVI